MIKSSLTDVVVEAHSSNYSKGRSGKKICKITPHHMAGVLTAEQCGKIFQSANRNASSNYGIGNDGKIACYVSEENRTWTSSSRNNDCQAITIEVSNCETGGSWKISEAAWNSLVNLCVDICKRYGFKLEYDGTPNGSLTRHNMFAKTACPGPYLQSRFQELADTVNARLEEKETPKENNEAETSNEIKVGDIVIVNGVGTADSYGNGPTTKNYENQEMKVIYVKDDGRSHPYALNQYVKDEDVTAWFKKEDVNLKG